MLFQTFAKRLYTGTIGEDGLDPLACWVPSSTDNVNKHIHRLTAFTDWLANKLGAEPMNPLRDATPHEQRLNYAAWYRKTKMTSLDILKIKTVNKTIRKARTMKGRTPLIESRRRCFSIPDKHWESFYKDGIGGAKDPRLR